MKRITIILAGMFVIIILSASTAMAQATQPAAVEYINGITAAVVAILGALTIAIPVAALAFSKLIDAVKSAKTEASSAMSTANLAQGGVTAVQQTATRISARQNTQAALITSIAQSQPATTPMPTVEQVAAALKE